VRVTYALQRVVMIDISKKDGDDTTTSRATEERTRVIRNETRELNESKFFIRWAVRVEEHFYVNGINREFHEIVGRGKGEMPRPIDVIIQREEYLHRTKGRVLVDYSERGGSAV